jgi:hypothetical protein
MSTIRTNTITDTPGTGGPNFPNGLTIGGASPTGNQFFTAKGAITIGDLLASTSTADSVEKVGIMTDGKTNGSWANYATFTGSTAGYVSYGRPVPMSSNTFVQARVNTASTFSIYASVKTIAADGTISEGVAALAVATTLSYGSGWYIKNSVIKISANKFMLFYAVAANTVNAIVGEVSGTTITFGSPVAIHGATSIYIAAASNGANQVLMHARNTGTPFGTKVTPLSVSGNVITVGTTNTFYTALTQYNPYNTDGLAYDPNSTNYIMLSHTETNSTPVATVFSVSGATVTAGTTASVGTETIQNTGATDLSIQYIPSIGRMAIILGSILTANTLRISTLTISGLTFTRSSNFVDVNLTAGVGNVSVLSATGELIVSSNEGWRSIYFDPSTYQPTAILIGGDTLPNFNWQQQPVPMPNGFYVHANASSPYNNYTAAITNASKLVGIANASATNGTSVSVTVNGGVCSAISGLVTGYRYHMTLKGALTLNPTGAYKTVGNAMSSTRLLFSPEHGVGI